MLRFDNERHWLRAAGRQVGHLFPRLLGQSEYNQRLKNAAPLMEAALRWLAVHTPGSAEMLRLMDATPVPCGHPVITAKRSDLYGWAGYGYCASHSRWYWGARLLLMCTCDGTVTGFFLANPELFGEREQARQMLEHQPANRPAPGTAVVTGKGLSGQETALESRELMEHRAVIRPGENIALFRAAMAAWGGPGPGGASLAAGISPAAAAAGTSLTCSGPLRSRDLPDTCAAPWQSAGWTSIRDVTQLLEFMVSRGEVAIAGRKGQRPRAGSGRAALSWLPGDPCGYGAGDPRPAAVAGPGCCPRPGAGLWGRAAGCQRGRRGSRDRGSQGHLACWPALVARPFPGRAAPLSPFPTGSSAAASAAVTREIEDLASWLPRSG